MFERSYEDVEGAHMENEQGESGHMENEQGEGGHIENEQGRTKFERTYFPDGPYISSVNNSWSLSCSFNSLKRKQVCSSDQIIKRSLL